MNPTFPLLNLPEKPLQIALQNMEPLYQLALSTLSARTKVLVKSLKIQIRKTNIHIREEISFSIWKLDFNQEDWYFLTNANDAYISNELEEPCYLETRAWVDDQIPIFLWRKEGFTVKNWVQHFLDVLNREEIDKLFFQWNPENLNLENLHQAIGDVNQIHIQHELSAERCLQIVQHFQSAQVLSMFFEISENFQKILLQNFEIVILTARQPPASIDLDTLLTINSCSIQLHRLIVTNKTLNRFLKHWIAGSNPNIRHLSILLPANEVFSETDVFRGVVCSYAAEDRELEFKDYMENLENPERTTVAGGIDIRRKESGTTATIKLEDGQLRMNVWDD